MKNSKVAVGLMARVSETISAMIARGDPVKKSWVVQALRLQVPRPHGEDAWYWLSVESAALEDLVSTKIRSLRRAEGGEMDPQLVMPGFERLQTHYSVERNNEQMFVPIDDLTVKEVSAKCDEFRRNIEGLDTHLQEFTRYHKERFAALETRTGTLQ